MRRFVVLAFLFAALASARAASFNCALAKSPREQAVCADKSLSALDSKTGESYSTLLHQLSPAAAEQVRQDQRSWLHWLDRACPAHTPQEGWKISDCLAQQYTRRLADLSATPGNTPGTVFYPRAYFGFKPDEDKDPIPNDPGFGTCEFSWPQIDSSTPNAAAWNAAAHRAAVNLAQDEDNKPPVDFSSYDCGGGTIDIDYDLLAANPHLVDVSFSVATYGYGAAHPQESRQSFLWWLDRSRAVTVDDVFSRPAASDGRIVDLLISKLGNLNERKEMGLDEKGVAGATREELAKTSAWTLSSSGLMITFNPYEIGPWALGAPTVCASWNELQPALNPALRAQDLPTLLPTRNDFVPSCRK